LSDSRSLCSGQIPELFSLIEREKTQLVLGWVCVCVTVVGTEYVHTLNYAPGQKQTPGPFFNDAHDKYGVNASYKSRISLD
jgi:hypothetical protein